MVGTSTGRLIHPGMDVLIQRSDGRIHPATISEVHTSTRSVCVEWRERNETKGKEVLLDLIFELNPLLCPCPVEDNEKEVTAEDATLVPAKASDRESSKSPSPKRNVKMRASPSNGLVPRCVEQKNHLRQLSAQLPNLQRKCPSLCQERLGAAPAPVIRKDSLKSQKGEDFERKNYLRRTQRLTEKPERQSPARPKPIQEQPQKCGPALSNLSVPEEQIRPQQQQRSYSSDPAAPNIYPDANPAMNMSRSSSSVASSRNESEKTKGGRFSNVESKIAGLVGDVKKTNCLIQIQRIAQKRQQRRMEQGVEQRRLNGNFRSGRAFRVNSGLHAAIAHQRQMEFGQMIEQYRKGLPSCAAEESMPDDGRGKERIIVSVRKRPLSSRERTRNELDIVSIVGGDVCVVHSPKEKVDLTKYLDNQKFRFDYAFSESATTELVYRCTVKPLVENILAGHHAMCFAYGQTGSGKTYTMGGTLVDGTNRVDCSNGIYALATKEIFRELDLHRPGEFSLFCSFFEIYCGKVFDLFNKKKRLQVMEDQRGVIQVVKLKQEHVRSVEELMSLIQYGMTIRTSGTTSANENSSRSHAVFQMILKANATGSDYGRISLIDLAGSERGKDTNSSNRSTLMEGAEINKSLLALKECIRALSTRAEHIPFRGSMLTRVLRDSFIGTDAKLSMIAMISPSDCNSEHTLNTLRYADRVKELRTIEGTAADEKGRLGDAETTGPECEAKRNVDAGIVVHTSAVVASREKHLSGGGGSEGQINVAPLKTKQASAGVKVVGGSPGHTTNNSTAAARSIVGNRKRSGPQLEFTSSPVVADMERQLLVAHKECVQNTQRFLTQIAQVLASACEETPTDSDRIRYATSFDSLLLEHIRYLNRVKLKTCAYKETIRWRNSLKPVTAADADSTRGKEDSPKTKDDCIDPLKGSRARRSLTS